MTNMLINAIKGVYTEDEGGFVDRASQGVIDFLKEAPISSNERQYLRELVKPAISDFSAAAQGELSIYPLLAMLTGTEGKYHGQPYYNLEDVMNSDYPKETLAEQNRDFTARGMLLPPNMIDVFLQNITPMEAGLIETQERPIGHTKNTPKYPWTEDKIYDLSPYMETMTNVLSKNPEKLTRDLKNLKEGETLNVTKDIKSSNFLANQRVSIDLKDYVAGFGRDEKGLYYSISDKFDTGGGSTGKLGDLVEEAIDPYPINLYGKKYINENNLDNFVEFFPSKTQSEKFKEDLNYWFSTKRFQE